MDIDAISRLIERSAEELAAAEAALQGQALYMQQVAEGIANETIHPDHLPVVGHRLSELKTRVEGLLAQAEQYLYLAT